MKIVLTKEESEKHFHNALCNGSQIRYYGLTLDYNEKDGYFISITKKRFETALKKDKNFMTKFDKRLTTNNNSYKLTSADINEASTIIERRQDEISKKVI
jgi:hypothetical protein